MQDLLDIHIQNLARIQSRHEAAQEEGNKYLRAAMEEAAQAAHDEHQAYTAAKVARLELVEATMAGKMPVPVESKSSSSTDELEAELQKHVGTLLDMANKAEGEASRLLSASTPPDTTD